MKPVDDSGRVQVVGYISGLGSDDLPVLSSKILNAIQGATGLGLAAKVKDAYLAIVLNYRPGDKLSIIGFSRGSYTARTVADLISHVGFLSREQLNNFAQIFSWYLMLASNDAAEQQNAAAEIEKIRKINLPESSAHEYLVDTLAVFDTVGARGIPGMFADPGTKKFLGFNDLVLSSRVRVALHAMALTEPRKDFQVTKWQYSSGEPTDQIVKQTWFAGAHSDVGGGYHERDLSDISMFWLAGNLAEHSDLAIDFDWLLTLPTPTQNKPYGQYSPHNPILQGGSAFKALEWTAVRDVELSAGWNERIHPSVFEQDISHWPKSLQTAITQARDDPSKVDALLPVEQTLRDKWSTYPTGVQETASLDSFSAGARGVVSRIINVFQPIFSPS